MMIPIVELIGSYRDTINSARDLYIANVSLQMDDTMRILTHTIFNTILLPSTVVAAIYGINGIDLMIIIGLAEGFAIVAMTMLVTIIVVTLFFLRKSDGFLILMTILIVWLKRRDILIMFYDVIFL